MRKILITVGLILIVAWLIVNFTQPGNIPRFPGDIYIKKEGYSFYFPLGWCILVSICITILFRIFGK